MWTLSERRWSERVEGERRDRDGGRGRNSGTEEEEGVYEGVRQLGLHDSDSDGLELPTRHGRLLPTRQGLLGMGAADSAWPTATDPAWPTYGRCRLGMADSERALSTRHGRLLPTRHGRLGMGAANSK